MLKMKTHLDAVGPGRHLVGEGGHDVRVALATHHQGVGGVRPHHWGAAHLVGRRGGLQAKEGNISTLLFWNKK